MSKPESTPFSDAQGVAKALGEVRQIYEVRELLQQQAALHIPLPAEAALVEALEALHTQFLQHLRERDFSALHRVNDAFHLTLFSGCGNPYLVDSIRHHMGLSLPVRAQRTAAAGHSEAAADEHLAMIQLLKGGDSAALVSKSNPQGGVPLISASLSADALHGQRRAACRCGRWPQWWPHQKRVAGDPVRRKSTEGGYDNALAETISGIYKAELVHRRPPERPRSPWSSRPWRECPGSLC